MKRALLGARDLFFEFLRLLGLFTGYPFYLVFYKPRVIYEDPASLKLRRRRGVLVISDHFSPLDYLLTMFLFFPQKVGVVASELAYRSAISSFGMRLCGGIRVDRDKKTLGFIDEAARTIKNGGVVQIYPEGRISRDGSMGRFHSTYLFIAARAGAPIVPVVLDGRYSIRRRTRVVVGEQISADEISDCVSAGREAAAALNEKIRENMITLKERSDERTK